MLTDVCGRWVCSSLRIGHSPSTLLYCLTYSSCEAQVRSHISRKPPEGLSTLGTNCSSVIRQVMTWRTEASCVWVSSPTMNSEDRALD